MTEQANWTAIAPRVLANRVARRLVRSCARQLARLPADDAAASVIVQTRSQAALRSRTLPVRIAPLALLCVHILCDLRAQGWRIRVSARRIDLASPIDDTESAEKRKAQ